MHGQRAAALKMATVAGDGLVVAATWLVAVQVRVLLGAVEALPPVELAGYAPLVLVVVPFWLAALAVVGAYRDLWRSRAESLLGRVLRGVGLAFVTLVVVLFALKQSASVSRLLLFGFALASIGSLFAGRLAMRAAWRRWAEVGASRVLLVGDEAAPAARAMRAHPEWGLSPVGTVAPERIEQALHEGAADQVLVAGVRDPEVLQRVATACERVGVRFSLDANFLGLGTARATLEDLDGWAMLTFSTTPAHPEALVVKRGLDVVLSAVGLVLLAPVFLAIAAAIKLDDGGPVLFRQTRSGLHGRPFTVLKFRSMVPGAAALQDDLREHNEMTGPVFKLRDDPRITRIGRLLRRTSLDELPQLVNVLRGEMSLVGPRPPLPDEVARYERWQLRRLSMRPGMTCTWQVSGRNEVDFDRWMELDLEYIDGWSLWGDLKLLARTVPAILRGEGAR